MASEGKGVEEEKKKEGRNGEIMLKRGMQKLRQNMETQKNIDMIN